MSKNLFVSNIADMVIISVKISNNSFGVLSKGLKFNISVIIIFSNNIGRKVMV